MKFRTKPAECELIEYRPATWQTDMPGDVSIRTRPDDLQRAAVWNELHQSAINLEPGDYVNVTNPGDYYPIKAHIVAAKYEPV